MRSATSADVVAFELTPGVAADIIPQEGHDLEAELAGMPASLSWQLTQAGGMVGSALVRLGLQRLSGSRTPRPI